MSIYDQQDIFLWSETDSWSVSLNILNWNLQIYLWVEIIDWNLHQNLYLHLSEIDRIMRVIEKFTSYNDICIYVSFYILFSRYNIGIYSSLNYRSIPQDLSPSFV